MRGNPVRKLCVQPCSSVQSRTLNPANHRQGVRSSLRHPMHQVDSSNLFWLPKQLLVSSLDAFPINISVLLVWASSCYPCRLVVLGVDWLSSSCQASCLRLPRSHWFDPKLLTFSLVRHLIGRGPLDKSSATNLRTAAAARVGFSDLFASVFWLGPIWYNGRGNA